MSKLLTNNAVSPTLKIAEIKIQFASLSKKKLETLFLFSLTMAVQQNFVFQPLNLLQETL